MRISPLFLLLFSIAGVSSASAQEGLAGSVVDQDGGALPRAHVRLVGADGAELAQSFSDARGAFRF
ncbi:MAG: carboxypeptidase-like regulatory domain-containing protein, partial [Vicinamibacterales bacterium]